MRPESVAAATFGLIAALAALVLAVQAIRRNIIGGRDERAILRALGASQFTIAVDICIAICCAVAAGSLLAVADGALLPAAALPPGLLAAGLSDRALRGLNTILVRFRPGAGDAAIQRLDRAVGRFLWNRFARPAGRVEGRQLRPRRFARRLLLIHSPLCGQWRTP